MFLFSHGKWTIPICSWFAFVFLIRFHRTTLRPLLALLTLWVGMSACQSFMYDGLLPVKGLLFHAVCLLVGATWVLPFIVDWLLYRRLDGFASTFLWPLLMVTINYFLAAYLPSLAHSQIEYLSLIQIVSITGMGGLVFLIYWFAATLNRIWESEFEWTLTKRDGAIFLGALLLVLVYGETRLAFANSQGETLQVAMINLQRNRLGSLDRFQPDIVRDLFAVSKKAVSADAKVIAWSEANVDIPLDYEDELVELGKEFAKDNQVFLFMSFRSFSTLSLNENKTIGISPGGDIVVDYLKSNLVPGIETQTRKGDGEVAIANINDIRTGHVICYDVDFASYIRQAGRRDVDILFVPSSDWREIRFLHATSARFRAVENGCSLVRPTVQGLSIATDPYGRMLAYHDYYSNTPRLSIVGVPSRGVRTIYALCGELFSLICIMLFFAFIGLAYLKGGATQSDADVGTCPLQS
jgi:apolipoprotein N-acyltransferase